MIGCAIGRWFRCYRCLPVQEVGHRSAGVAVVTWQPVLAIDRDDPLSLRLSDLGHRGYGEVN